MCVLKLLCTLDKGLLKINYNHVAKTRRNLSIVIMKLLETGQYVLKLFACNYEDTELRQNWLMPKMKCRFNV